MKITFHKVSEFRFNTVFFFIFILFVGIRYGLAQDTDTNFSSLSQEKQKEFVIQTFSEGIYDETDDRIKSYPSNSPIYEFCIEVLENKILAPSLSEKDLLLIATNHPKSGHPKNLSEQFMHLADYEKRKCISFTDDARKLLVDYAQSDWRYDHILDGTEDPVYERYTVYRAKKLTTMLDIDFDMPRAAKNIVANNLYQWIKFMEKSSHPTGEIEFVNLNINHENYKKTYKGISNVYITNIRSVRSYLSIIHESINDILESTYQVPGRGKQENESDRFYFLAILVSEAIFHISSKDTHSKTSHAYSKAQRYINSISNAEFSGYSNEYSNFILLRMFSMLPYHQDKYNLIPPVGISNWIPKWLKDVREVHAMDLGSTRLRDEISSKVMKTSLSYHEIYTFLVRYPQDVEIINLIADEVFDHNVNYIRFIDDDCKIIFLPNFYDIEDTLSLRKTDQDNRSKMRKIFMDRMVKEIRDYQWLTIELLEKALQNEKKKGIFFHPVSDTTDVYFRSVLQNKSMRNEEYDHTLLFSPHQVVITNIKEAWDMSEIEYQEAMDEFLGKEVQAGMYEYFIRFYLEEVIKWDFTMSDTMISSIREVIYEYSEHVGIDNRGFLDFYNKDEYQSKFFEQLFRQTDKHLPYQRPSSENTSGGITTGFFQEPGAFGLYFLDILDIYESWH
ncbi:MAG: hypothetical protein KDD52_05260 [Bdellovibrionales bacterium]|nr:hypothetical protein [Bdellovibrionales bacterium]